MAYNRENILIKIIEIQETTLKHTKLGVTQKFIFENHIKPIHHISLRTYKEYLGTNAKKELKQLRKQKEKNNA